MPGPKPTPTVLLSRDSWRANSRPFEPLPEPASDILPPHTLTGKARDVWVKLAPKLVAVGLLTSVDTIAFERYVRLLAVFDDCMGELEAGSDRATVLTVAKIDEMLRRMEANFGLTPADRAGIVVEASPATTDKSRFFKSG